MALTFKEYFTTPCVELFNHPDFDETEFRRVMLISELTLEDIRRTYYREFNVAQADQPNGAQDQAEVANNPDSDQHHGSDHHSVSYG